MLKLPVAIATALLISAAAIAQTGSVEVTDAWARATPRGAENGALYLTMRAATADRLTGLTTPIAEKAELHSMTMDGGIMRMTQLAAVDLPAGQPVTLKPGALHIMLTGLKQPLQPGQSIPLTLRFENAGIRDIAVAVGKVGAAGPQSHAESGPRKAPHH